MAENTVSDSDSARKNVQIWICVLLINKVLFKKNANKTYLYCARSKPQQDQLQVQTSLEK